MRMNSLQTCLCMILLLLSTGPVSAYVADKNSDFGLLKDPNSIEIERRVLASKAKET